MYPMGLSDAHFYSRRIALLATSGYRPCLCREDRSEFKNLRIRRAASPRSAPQVFGDA